MPIVMLINLKGGVAKTTTAVAVAECLASQGRRTLLIDADHQSMAGELLLGEAGQVWCDDQRRTLHDLLAAMLDDDFDPAATDGFITRGASNIAGGLAGLAVLPCSIRIDSFSTNMAKARRGHRDNDEFLALWNRRRQQLRAWLARQFDYTVVDCPPSMALQVRFLLGLADGFVVPTVPDRLSVRGSLHLMGRVRAQGFRATGLGTAWTLYRQQNAMHRRIVAAAAAAETPYDALPRPFETVIPNASAIAAAAEIDAAAPASFRHKYSPEFAGLFEKLVGELVQRAESTTAQKKLGVESGE